MTGLVSCGTRSWRIRRIKSRIYGQNRTFLQARKFLGSIYWHARGNLTVSTIQRLGSIIAVARQVLEVPRLAPIAAWSGFDFERDLAAGVRQGWEG
jgi:hypothetical protein